MTLSRQSYETVQRPVKMLQIGEGNFLRGFIDWQIQQLNQHTDFNGGIAVVQPRGSQKIAPLNAQQGLYTVCLQGLFNGEEINTTEVIDAIQYGIDLQQHYDAFIELAQLEEMRFVFSNATEAGIFFDPEESLSLRPQRTFPGKLLAFLHVRYTHFKGAKDKGLIIIPTELIAHNGETLKQVLVQLANAWQLDDAFQQWLTTANTFCNTLVDRIVPGYSEEAATLLPYEDNLLVVAEPYMLFAIEAPDFVMDELPLHQLGINAFLTDDLTPYHTQKVRILNGSHTALTPLAMLLGIETVAQAVSDDVLGPFIEQVVFEEIVGTIQYDAAIVTKFANSVLERFRNPFIAHAVKSISLNSFSKFETRNVPTIVDYIHNKQAVPKRLALALAGLLYFYNSKHQLPLNDDEEKIYFVQTIWQQLDRGETSMEQATAAWLSSKVLWHTDLTTLPGLVAAVSATLEAFEQQGVAQTIQQHTTPVSR